MENSDSVFLGLSSQRFRNPGRCAQRKLRSKPGYRPRTKTPFHRFSRQDNRRVSERTHQFFHCTLSITSLSTQSILDAFCSRSSLDDSTKLAFQLARDRFDAAKSPDFSPLSPLTSPSSSSSSDNDEIDEGASLQFDQDLKSSVEVLQSPSFAPLPSLANVDIAKLACSSDLIGF